MSARKKVLRKLIGKPQVSKPLQYPFQLRGRKPGSVSRFTTLKSSFLNVYEQLGGDQGLFNWIAEDPRSRMQIFYGWIVRMLPRAVDVDIPQDSTLQNLLEKYKGLNPNDLRDRVAGLVAEVTRASGIKLPHQ